MSDTMLDIASIGGGLLDMWSGHSSSKAAGKYSDMSKEATAKAEEYMGKAESTLDTVDTDIRGKMELAREDLGGQEDYAYEFEQMMRGLSEQYGSYAQDMWADWESTFGSIRDNLVQHYETLDPGKYSAMTKHNIGRQLDASMKKFEEAAAQSGIYTSPMRMQAQKEMNFEQAKGNALADIQAGDQVNAMKEGFYGQFGEPYRQQAQGTMGNSINTQAALQAQGFNPVYQTKGSYADNSYRYGNSIQDIGDRRVNLYNNITGKYLDSASGYAQAAGQAQAQGSKKSSSGLGAVIGGIASIFSDVRLKNNITQIGREGPYNVYEWDWNDDLPDFVKAMPTKGVLAQEVQAINPSAVSTHPSGYLMVNYGRL